MSALSNIGSRISARQLITRLERRPAMTEPTVRLSIVLPCYNEAQNLPILLQRYRESWEDLPAELVMVDNGSTDNTPEILQRLSACSEYPFARSIRVPKNRGYGYGVMAGL